jgi:hypothetical protein
MGIAFDQSVKYQDDRGFNLYRSGLSPNQSACEVAKQDVAVDVPGASRPSRIRSICNNASEWYAAGVTSAVLGSLLFAGGAALIVTSPTLWPKLTGKPAPFTSTLEVVPLASPEHAGLLVRGRL